MLLHSSRRKSAALCFPASCFPGHTSPTVSSQVVLAFNTAFSVDEPSYGSPAFLTSSVSLLRCRREKAQEGEGRKWAALSSDLCWAM